MVVWVVGVLGGGGGGVVGGSVGGGGGGGGCGSGGCGGVGGCCCVVLWFLASMIHVLHNFLNRGKLSSVLMSVFIMFQCFIVLHLKLLLVDFNLASLVVRVPSGSI